jgi:predicted DNA-binding transcriptional regulator YafY
MIDRPQGVTVDDAARDLECTIRTIWRDLDALQKAGFPLYTERAADGNRGIWRVTEDFKRALPLKLTLAELASLLMSRHLLSPLGLSVLGPEVASAFDKIQNVLSRDALKVLDQIRDHLGVRPTGAKLQAPAAEHLPKIHQALAEHRTLWSATATCATPSASSPSGGCDTVELTRTRFDVPADFDSEHYLEGAWRILRGDLVTVRVVFARALAPYIRERVWHPSQKLRDLPDGRVEMTLAVADTLEVRRWILGYGVQAEAVAPEGLREALRVEAKQVAAMLQPQRRPLSPAAGSLKPRATAISR